MNFKSASDIQLNIIAYIDSMATTKDQLQAREEIKRRAKRKYRRVNFREKVTG